MVSLEQQTRTWSTQSKLKIWLSPLRVFFLIKKRKLLLFNPINSIYKIPSIIAVRLNLPNNRDFLRNKSDIFTFSPHHNYNGLFSKLSINLQMIWFFSNSLHSDYLDTLKHKQRLLIPFSKRRQQCNIPKLFIIPFMIKQNCVYLSYFFKLIRGNFSLTIILKNLNYMIKMI